MTDPFDAAIQPKTDLSSLRITAHARLIIIRDLLEVLKDIAEHTDQSELLCGDWGRYAMAQAEAEHHLFVYKEQLTPVLYPAEQRKKDELDREPDEFNVGDLEIEPPDDEFSIIEAEVERTTEDLR